MGKIKELADAARKLGFDGSTSNPYELRDWLREAHQIHVETGCIWDETGNLVESYFYTVTAPIFIYYTQQVYFGGGKAHREMLQQGVQEGLQWLSSYKAQKHLEVNDDQVVIAYLKGYRDKDDLAGEQRKYPSNLENYAYQQGKQGDYIEEGLTEDDIVRVVRNKIPDEEKLRLQ
ncbi:MAG: hypothetical protein WBL27_04530 [Salinimicrobium sp.]